MYICPCGGRFNSTSKIDRITKRKYNELYDNQDKKECSKRRKTNIDTIKCKKIITHKS
jgi:hypothetical protein